VGSSPVKWRFFNREFSPGGGELCPLGVNLALEGRTSREPLGMNDYIYVRVNTLEVLFRRTEGSQIFLPRDQLHHWPSVDKVLYFVPKSSILGGHSVLKNLKHPPSVICRDSNRKAETRSIVDRHFVGFCAERLPP
jgi:hypothetical protein